MKDTPQYPKSSWLSYICHQDPARSFFINGKQMKLCARCTGIYIGFLIGIIAIILILFFNPSFELSPLQIFLILIIGVTPLALDGFTQYWGLRKSTNYIRASTGLICGTMCSIIIIWVIYDIII